METRSEKFYIASEKNSVASIGNPSSRNVEL